jgi:hypothetical protein
VVLRAEGPAHDTLLARSEGGALLDPWNTRFTVTRKAA